MKKVLVPLLLLAGLLSTAAIPQPMQAQTEMERINAELKALNQEKEAAMNSKAYAEKELESIQKEKQATQASINRLLTEIDKAGTQVRKLTASIQKTTDQLQTAAEQLDEAEERVEERDSLLRQRVRLMYTHGKVSYLEVLMSSTSFSDFLDRYRALKMIVNQDKDLLEQNKSDRTLISEQKEKVAVQLAKVKKDHIKMMAIQKQLVAKEKQKEVQVLSLSNEEQYLGEISEEQDKQLMAFASKSAVLLNKRADVQRQLERAAAAREAARKAAAEKAAAAARAAQAKSSGSNSNASATVSLGGGQFGMPIDPGRPITSGFGSRIDPITHKAGEVHSGVDFGAPQGTDIYAAEEGVVIVAAWYSGYGNCVIIDHGDGIWTLYGHIRNGGINVKEGDYVKRGQKIAEVGSTGRSTGNHLHFEVRINERAVNPLPYLR